MADLAAPERDSGRVVRMELEDVWPLFRLRLRTPRLELRVALEEFHRRIPDYRIADGAEVHYSTGIRQAEQLPLEFEPA